MAAPDLQHVVARASEWAREAGDVALSRLGTRYSIERKADRSPVTEVDLQLQQLIVDHILHDFPTHGIVAEEADRIGLGDATPQERDCFWIVDPLDGTRNYVRGVPFFCVAIAMMKAGQPIVGVIHDPNCNRTYTAIRGRGAFAGHKRLRVSNRGWAESPLLGIPTAKRTPLPAAIYRDWPQRGVLRHIGSTCLNLALTACGALDACFAQEVKLWDVAAGALLVEEAGGVVTSARGQNIFPIDPNTYQGEDIAFLAGGQPLHGELLKSLRH